MSAISIVIIVLGIVVIWLIALTVRIIDAESLMTKTMKRHEDNLRIIAAKVARKEDKTK